MSAAGSRHCFIHIGLHKTGSTSIQRLLSMGAEQLPGRGLHYPLAGRVNPLSGHHNLAWELTRDRRYDVHFGSTADLFAEIARLPHEVIVSSEDFEGAVGHLDDLRRFSAGLRDLGFDPVAVIYVRDQVEALGSVYLALLRNGLDQPFDQFLRAVMRSGRFAWKEWIFNFDYAYLARCLRECAMGVRVRSYSAAGGQVGADFLSVLGLSVTDLGLAIEPHENPTRELAFYVRAYLHNRWGITADEALSGKLAERGLDMVSKAISPDVRMAISERFAASNRELLDQHGIDLTGAGPGSPSGEVAALYIDRIFVDTPSLASIA